VQDVMHQKVWQRERLKTHVVVGVAESVERGKAPRVWAYVEKAPAPPDPSGQRRSGNSMQDVGLVRERCVVVQGGASQITCVSCSSFDCPFYLAVPKNGWIRGMIQDDPAAEAGSNDATSTVTKNFNRLVCEMEKPMDTSEWSLRQGHRLLQMGVLLFLFALLVGLVVPRFSVPCLGLSAHLLGITQGLFLMVTGLLWPKLVLTHATSLVGFWLAVYGCFAAWTANVLAGVWGAGNSLLPMAAGQAHGSALQEGIIAISLRTAAVSLIAASLLILWGLRVLAVDKSDQ
jgi:hydroxylaminobenzene mutase